MGVFRMPSLGADMEAGKLVEWLVRPGDVVSRGDVVAVVETQKGAIEIEIFEDGTVARLIADLDQDLPVGAEMALVLAPGEELPPDCQNAGTTEPAPPPSELSPAEALVPADAVDTGPRGPAEMAAIPSFPAPTPSAPIPATVGAAHRAASPAARIRAGELGLDLATIPGSGPAGAVVLADVEAAPRPSLRQDPRSPLEEMRKAIAAAMTRSKRTIPHFYISHTIDIQSASDWLAARNEDRPPADRILLGAIFIRAATLAAAASPTMNGHWIDGSFRPSAVVNTGVAVALRGGGLVAPALMDASDMTLEATMAGMRDLVTRARTGRLRGSEMTQGTITVSSLGDTGAEAMAGVIFPPQVALVGLGAPHVRPWVIAGEVVPRTVVALTLSADHRVSDGRQAARFISEFETLIQTPEAL